MELANVDFTALSAGALPAPFVIVTGEPSNFTLSGSALEVSPLSADCTEYYNVSVPVDQYAEVVYDATHNTALVGMGPAVRVSTTARTYYRVIGSQAGWELKRRVAGAATILGSAATTTFTAGDVLRIQIKGYTITLYKNGVLFFTYADNDTAHYIRSGLWGFTYSSTDTAGAGLRSFRAGDLLASNNTIATRQELMPAFWNATNLGHPTITIPAVIAGSSIHMGLFVNSARSIVSITDPDNNTWQAFNKSSAEQTGNNTNWDIVATNINTANDVTVTVNLDLPESYGWIAAKEIFYAAANPVAGKTVKYTASATTFNTGTIVNSQTPALISSYCTAIFNSTATNLVCDQGGGLANQNAGTSGIVASGSARLTNTAPQLASYTMTGGIAGQAYTSFVIFGEFQPVTPASIALTCQLVVGKTANQPFGLYGIN